MRVSGSGPGLFGLGFQMKQHGYYEYDHSYYITILIVITTSVITIIIIIIINLGFIISDIRMEERCKTTLSMLQNAAEPHGTPTKRALPAATAEDGLCCSRRGLFTKTYSRDEGIQCSRFGSLGDTLKHGYVVIRCYKGRYCEL